ncbi:NmrA family NAD(P)-binding protein [Dactylosporangium sp. AC04546]|uniref:NmrA family NAD(P)-binding protein n=1 Tax=Dactylosporangium sp. AC04546 TaxID=2862460 RepID=UPI001EDD919A|nr:NmrA family NAD(P)-binding protein [Dactylosporangium sp. AC04546]WVK78411.1 NmrA family NAD(P)-binding protein [Dactylosporangium sp. AC04546]
MTVLVTGATGSTGSAAAAALVQQGAPVRALVRGPDRAALLPAGVEAVFGDLRDPAAVEAALTGVTAALYVSPHEPDEERLAETFVAACERLGVRLVFAGVVTDSVFLRALVGVMLPHYRGKLRIARRIARSSARPVLFSVTNFYQNDELVREDILAGTYPLPVHGSGVNRIDLRDVGDLVARALTEPQFPGGIHALCGPASVGGAEAAQTWTQVLGRPVRYAPEEWQAASARRLSGHKLVDFRKSYGFLARRGMPTSARDVARMTALLGRAPRPYGDYVRDMAEAWQAVS